MFYSELIFAYFRFLGNLFKRFELEEEKKIFTLLITYGL